MTAEERAELRRQKQAFRDMALPISDEDLEALLADSEALEDTQRLTRELDVAMHGEDAAKQASLCDLIPLAKRLRSNFEVLEQVHNETCEELEGAKAEIARLRRVLRNLLVAIDKSQRHLDRALAAEKVIREVLDEYHNSSSGPAFAVRFERVLVPKLLTVIK